jgi:hypothetical protein
MSFSTNSELQAEIDQLKTQQADTVKVLRAFLGGHLDGDGTSAAWQLAAIDPAGGNVSVADFAFGQP